MKWRNCVVRWPNLVVTLAVAACSRGDATAPAQAGAPTALLVVGGNNQSALGGAQVSQSITFKLVDAAGTGVPNTRISFSISAGEGALAIASTTSTTNQAGVVTAPSWTLGKLIAPQQLTASAGNISAIVTAAVSTQFNAQLRFFGPPINPAYQGAFTRAINRLNAEIIGALTPVTFSNQDVASTCGVTGVAPLNEQIGSVVIYVSVDSTKAAGGIAASSGPCFVRQSNHLTVIGTISLNAAQLPAIFVNGQLNDVLLHEMQHVLGFGTLWSSLTPALIVNAGTPQTAFTGAAGIRGCQQAGGALADCVPSIPLENNGGPGTADSHWRSTIFGNELMTAFLAAPGTAKVLSEMTIGSLSDLGYQTNGNVADNYTIPSAVAASVAKLHGAVTPTLGELNEVVWKPRFTVTRDGLTSAIP
jgi:hypothetical protein